VTDKQRELLEDVYRQLTMAVQTDNTKALGRITYDCRKKVAEVLRGAE
jgi:hypothetical protein